MDNQSNCEKELIVRLSVPEMAKFKTFEEAVKKIPETFGEHYTKIRVEISYCHINQLK